MLCSAQRMSYLTHKEVKIMNSYTLSVGKFVSEHPEKKVQNIARYLNESNLKEAFKRLRSRKVQPKRWRNLQGCKFPTGTVLQKCR